MSKKKRVYLYNEDDEYLATIWVPVETKYIATYSHDKMIECFPHKPKYVRTITGLKYFDGFHHHIESDAFYGDPEYCEKNNLGQYLIKIDE